MEHLLPDVIGDSLGPPDLSVPSGSTWHQQSEMEGAREAQRAGAQLLAHAGKELFHILNVRRPGQVVRLHKAIILIHQLCQPRLSLLQCSRIRLFNVFFMYKSFFSSVSF